MQLTLNNETIQHIARGASTARRTLAGTMGQALAGFPSLDRGSSTTKPIHSVTNPSISDWSNVVIYCPRLLPCVGMMINYPLQWLVKQLQNNGKGLMFSLDSVNHISALLHKSCHKKQEISADFELRNVFWNYAIAYTTMALIPFILVGVDAPLFLFPFTGVGTYDRYWNRRD